MFHDFVDGGDPYSNCRKNSDSSSVPCDQCANYQANNTLQPIGRVTGDANDCCNGFMGYYNHSHIWSDCSARFFQEHYISEGWSACMDCGKGEVS